MNLSFSPNNQFYIQDLEKMRDRLDGQINQLKQLNYQTPITQNFQLAPNSNLKFVNNFDDVQKDIVIADTYFLTNDFTQMWIKNTRGDIRSFNLQEIKQKDEKDLMIENLQKQIDELKGEQNDKSNNERTGTEISNTITTTESSNVPAIDTSKTE